MSILQKLLFATAIVLCSTFSEAQIAGKVYKESGCASGGDDYYFFEDNSVISECDGCEWLPYIKYGTYDISGDKVIVHMQYQWYGKGEGDILHVSSINHYEKYAARSGEYNSTFELPLNMFLTGKTEDCTEIAFHNKSNDPYDWLRNDMEGEYPEAYLRKLTDADLRNKSKEELRFMRNEIYARYGYSFSSADLKAHFKAMEGYYEWGKDVEAFLSDIEKYNVKLIQSFERK